MTDKKIVNLHVEKLHTNIEMVTPSHPDRTESSIFRKSKQKLREDGNMKCFVCNSTKDIQVHHFAVEYSEKELADLNKVKQFVEMFDPYGYGKLYKDTPLESVEDCRCLISLCQEHHTGNDSTNGGTSTSIHGCPFPQWIMQKLSLDGLCPIPQESETLEMCEQKIRDYQSKEVKNEPNK